MLVVGDREAENGQVAVRLRTNEDLGAMSIESFIERVQALVAARDNANL
jgi:threonyl-tRNA synthetase